LAGQRPEGVLLACTVNNTHEESAQCLPLHLSEAWSATFSSAPTDGCGQLCARSCTPFWLFGCSLPIGFWGPRSSGWRKHCTYADSPRARLHSSRPSILRPRCSSPGSSRGMSTEASTHTACRCARHLEHATGKALAWVSSMPEQLRWA